MTRLSEVSGTAFSSWRLDCLKSQTLRERVSKVWIGLDNSRNRLFISCLTVFVDVTPAFASIMRDRWIPAFAGMTTLTYEGVGKGLMVILLFCLTHHPSLITHPFIRVEQLPSDLCRTA